MRVVNFPPRGIGARSLEQLQDAARAGNSSLRAAVSQITGKAGTSIGAFVAKIEVLREQTTGMTLRQIMELVLDASGLLQHYKEEKEGADRVENLEELVNAAESFVTQEGFGRDAVALPIDELGRGLTQSPVSQGLDPDLPAPEALAPDQETGETLSPLAAFLTHAALEAGDNQAQSGQDAVQLMTVHASKGLEFDCVFISGLEEGLFPHENSMSDRDGLEEERRLMYVAMTRARDRLYLSHSQTRMLHGQTRYHVRSRFLEELPEESLKWLAPKQPRYPSSPGFAASSGAPRSWSTGAAAGFRPGTLGAVAPSATPAAGALRAGQRVFHNKFGEGSILTLEGVGDDARAQISFPRHGTKWLALAVAKLTPVP